MVGRAVRDFCNALAMQFVVLWSCSPGGAVKLARAAPLAKIYHRLSKFNFGARPAPFPLCISVWGGRRFSKVAVPLRGWEDATCRRDPGRRRHVPPGPPPPEAHFRRGALTRSRRGPDRARGLLHHLDVGLNEGLAFVVFCEGFATKIIQECTDIRRRTLWLSQPAHPEPWSVGRVLDHCPRDHCPRPVLALAVMLASGSRTHRRTRWRNRCYGAAHTLPPSHPRRLRPLHPARDRAGERDKLGVGSIRARRPGRCRRRRAVCVHAPWITSACTWTVWDVADGCPLNPGWLRCPTAAVAAFDAAVLRGHLLWADSPMNLNSGVVGEPGMYSNFDAVSGTGFWPCSLSPVLHSVYSPVRAVRRWASLHMVTFDTTSGPS